MATIDIDLFDIDFDDDELTDLANSNGYYLVGKNEINMIADMYKRGETLSDAYAKRLIEKITGRIL